MRGRVELGVVRNQSGKAEAATHEEYEVKRLKTSRLCVTRQARASLSREVGREPQCENQESNSWQQGIAPSEKELRDR
jgi:hypothetical protein